MKVREPVVCLVRDTSKFQSGFVLSDHIACFGDVKQGIIRLAVRVRNPLAKVSDQGSNDRQFRRSSIFGELRGDVEHPSLELEVSNPESRQFTTTQSG
jgi:hypothetical protein